VIDVIEKVLFNYNFILIIIKLLKLKEKDFFCYKIYTIFFNNTHIESLFYFNNRYVFVIYNVKVRNL